MRTTYAIPAEEEINTWFWNQKSLGNLTRELQLGSLCLFEEIQCRPGEETHSQIAPGMDVITLVVDGTIVHKNALGMLEILAEYEAHCMPSENGIQFSEFNPLWNTSSRYLRIGLRSNPHSIQDHYGRAVYYPCAQYNEFVTLSSLNEGLPTDKANQLARLQLGVFTKNSVYCHHLENQHLFIFAVEGAATLKNRMIPRGQYSTFSNGKTVDLTIESGSTVLLIDLPD